MLYPPYLPVFGHGAPGGAVPHTATYFDVDTVPFTPYIYEAAAWHTYGGGSAGSNATSIQGIAVDPTPPTNGQTLVYNGGGNKYIPTNAAAAVPTIVQHGMSATNTVVLGAAPTQGNLLVCIAAHNGNAMTPNNPQPGMGWANFFKVDGVANDGFIFLYKIVAAGEAASQNPFTNSPTGVTAIWEISGYVSGVIDVAAGQHDVVAIPTITQSLTTTGANELILVILATATNNLNLPTGIAGFTQDDTVSASNRAGVSGHTTAAVAGVFNMSATWAVNPTPVVTAAIAII